MEPYDDGTVYLDEYAPAGLVYYFDSVGGNDANAGTTSAAPWKSLTKFNAVVFPPGSTIYLKRGSVWTGSAIIKSNGTASARIRYTAYGTGAPPVFRNPGGTGYYKVAIRIRGDYNNLQYVKLQDSLLAGVYIDEGADYNIVTNVEATNVGEGVSIHGTYNKVLRSYFHDLVMVHNDPGGDDDYGAVGVWLFNNNNEVAQNRMVNCRAPSYDYGEDGGAVELYGKGSNNYIHHNYVNNAMGFMEIGTGTAYYNNFITYNVIVNSGRMIRLHLIGTPPNPTSGGCDLRITRWWIPRPAGYAVFTFYYAAPNPGYIDRSEQYLLSAVHEEDYEYLQSCLDSPGKPVLHSNWDTQLHQAFQRDSRQSQVREPGSRQL